MEQHKLNLRQSNCLVILCFVLSIFNYFYYYFLFSFSVKTPGQAVKHHFTIKASIVSMLDILWIPSIIIVINLDLKVD